MVYRGYVVDNYWPNTEVRVGELKNMYKKLVALDREAANKASANGA